MHESTLERELGTDAVNFLEVWPILPENFATVFCYLVNGSASAALTDREVWVKMVIAYAAVARHLIPTDEISANHWIGHADALSAITFFPWLVLWAQQRFEYGGQIKRWVIEL